MNVLFVMYGDLSSNSTYPMALHARGLRAAGHDCAAALPSLAGEGPGADAAFRTVLYDDVLADPVGVFRNGQPADIVHAWTPREGVRRFVTNYLSRRATPWIIYLEDNERWLAKAALSLVGLPEDVLLQHTEEVITTWTPPGLPHPLRFESFIGLADAAVVIQDKLADEVPPWVPGTTVMPGVDLKFFSPRPADLSLRRRFGVADNERVIVYPGGLNAFTRPGLEALCRAVTLINQHGVHCRLLRSGPVALDFLDRLAPEEASYVQDLGPLPRAELPDLLALADLFVQPGKRDAFEDLRLPGKLPELLAMGRPVIMPDVNISSMIRDGIDAVLHRNGSPEEIAEKCIALLHDPKGSADIGRAGRRFAETHFDPWVQAARLEAAYRAALDAYQPSVAQVVWNEQSGSESPALLLARRLRLLAPSDNAGGARAGGMLRTHSRALELAHERARGLEAGMAVRDREISSLKEGVDALGARLAALEEGTRLRDCRITSLEGMLDVSARESAENAARLSETWQTLAEREARIAGIEGSVSWRLTRPLRSVLDLVRRLLAHRS